MPITNLPCAHLCRLDNVFAAFVSYCPFPTEINHRNFYVFEKVHKSLLIDNDWQVMSQGGHRLGYGHSPHHTPIDRPQDGVFDMTGGTMHQCCQVKEIEA